MRFAELDAVTVDGFGTLVGLIDPVPALARALLDRGVERPPEHVRHAFETEARYYRPNAVAGRDPASLAALRLECTGVFLEAGGADLDPASFVDAFMGAIEFEPIEGAVETVRRLRACGLEVAIASNWDIGLHEHLDRLGLSALFTTVVTSAEAGAAKPDPAVFRLAMSRLAIEPGRALHVGDEPGDEEGAAAAGMRFAHAPLSAAFEGWT
ncbi:MAG TPA: HAD-IA family hydrolase [Gaiellaceae bacterium]|nr:HAD-IA family hydrolase [Gaiellaceae bacterium]